MLVGMLLMVLCCTSAVHAQPASADGTVPQNGSRTVVTDHEQTARYRYAAARYTEEPMAQNVWLKTNLAGWGMLVQNMAIEVTLASRFTLSVPVYYSSLNYFHRNIKFRGFGLQPEVRYYPQTATDCRLQPYIGVHASFAYYNYALGGDYRYQDHDKRRPLGGGGLHFGVRLPFRHEGHDTRWGMEAQIGIGVAFMQTDKFENTTNGQRTDSYDHTYFGIDNLAVTLYYALRSPHKKNHVTAHE